MRPQAVPASALSLTSVQALAKRLNLKPPRWAQAVLQADAAQAGAPPAAAPLIKQDYESDDDSQGGSDE